MKKKAEVHETTHGTQQGNECKVCEFVMKFNSSGKDHIDWNHSKVPRHQNSNESANTQHLVAQMSHNMTNGKDDNKIDIQVNQNQKKGWD